MYKCPKAECDSNEFIQFGDAIETRFLNENGVVARKEFHAGGDLGPVKCRHCAARAEWIDARQMEMFAVEPAMFG